jgi:putative phage-type endonuclease
MTDLTQIEQNTEEWLRARCGSLGASDLGAAMAKVKSGWSETRADKMVDIALERLTGEPTAGYVSREMAEGKEREPKARNAYSLIYGVDVVPTGIWVHPRIKDTHASPDGLVGGQGAIEIKCPSKKTHWRNLMGAAIDKAYRLQCDWVMACTGRLWVDLISFHDQFPVEMQLHRKRIDRDQLGIEKLEADVEQFLKELDEQMTQVHELFGLRAVA